MMIETKQRILIKSKELFIKRGYTATSMREIAEETGIGKATIYHHFKDKESILRELLDESTGKMNNDLIHIGLVTDPIGRFRAAANVSMRTLVNSAEIFRIARRELPASRHAFTEKMTRFFNNYTALLKEALDTGITLGLFRQLNTEETAKIFLSMLQGSFASAYITGKKPELPEKQVENLLDIFLFGIQIRN